MACENKQTVKPLLSQNVQFQKISIPTPRMVNGNSRGGGVQKPKVSKESMKLNQNFQEGEGFKLKKPSMGGV